MSQLLSIFPLPNLILYPGSMVPLHFFEPRYLRLMEDLLASRNHYLVAGTLLPGWEETYFENPKLFQVAGLGEVQQASQDTKGNFNLVLKGLHRVRIVSEPKQEGPTLPYRKVLVDTLQEPLLPSTQAPLEAKALLEALSLLTAAPADHAAGRSLNYLTDVLLVQLPLAMPHKLALFSLCNPRIRAQAVLTAWKKLEQKHVAPPSPEGPDFHPENN